MQGYVPVKLLNRAAPLALHVEVAGSAVREKPDSCERMRRVTCSTSTLLQGAGGGCSPAPTPFMPLCSIEPWPGETVTSPIRLALGGPLQQVKGQSELN